jgi:hypothetical protein
MKDVPDEKVAAQIVADIRKEKLLPAKKAALLKQKLATDGLDEGDWVLLADLSSSEEG